MSKRRKVVANSDDEYSCISQRDDNSPHFKIKTSNQYLTIEEFVKEAENAPSFIVYLICKYREPSKQESPKLTLYDSLAMHESARQCEPYVLNDIDNGLNKVVFLRWLYKWILFSTGPFPESFAVSPFPQISKHDVRALFRIKYVLENLGSRLCHTFAIKFDRAVVVPPQNQYHCQKDFRYQYINGGDKELRELQNQIFRDHVNVISNAIGFPDTQTLNRLVSLLCIRLLCFIVFLQSLLS